MELISQPSEIKACGTKEKIIREFFGRVNNGDTNVSIAMMSSPEGWEEPGQQPDFDEYTLILNGTLCVETRNGVSEIKEGQAVKISKGEWVKYSTPFEGGADYVSVCLPAFSTQTVNRDSE